MILDNASYNKIKLLHEISEIVWFLEKHALRDAENAGDQESYNELLGLQRELERHIERLRNAICIISQ
ncbi:MAG TPA: hypothetical protein VHA52_13055 [Candidatus Babeliaceae bacterium]|nr:hypothetical protein [Candidatus Babeliaceae bacterium]